MGGALDLAEGFALGAAALIDLLPAAKEKDFIGLPGPCVHSDSARVGCLI